MICRFDTKCIKMHDKLLDTKETIPCVRIYYTPSPLRYALTIKDPVGSGTTM